MKFTVTLSARFYLAQKLGISNKEASIFIANKRLLVNGKVAQLKQGVTSIDRIELDGQVLNEGEKLIYLAYYKPKGIECTLNPEIENNLAACIDLPTRVFPVGRLDKQSEGLLLLTNDGKIFNSIVDSKVHQEKEYIVAVEKPLTEEAVSKLSSGIKILGQTTRPAKVLKIDDFTFRIILTQGLNRQIRRMCHKVDNEVVSLKRIRIVNIELGNLPAGKWRYLSESELQELWKTIQTTETLKF